MDEFEAFLTAIDEQPDDDAIRLVFADWLEEHGQAERAEFIRLQCGFANGELIGDTFEDRIFDLAEQGRREWTKHLPQADGVTWEFRRGFPEELQIEVWLILERWSDWSNLSRVRYLTLWDTTAYFVRAFAEKKWNPQWRGLCFVEEPRPWLHEQPIDPTSGIRAIAMSPMAARLHELSFGYYGMSDEAITVLCESPYLDNLFVLGINKQSVTDPRLVRKFGRRLQPCRWS